MGAAKRFLIIPVDERNRQARGEIVINVDYLRVATYSDADEVARFYVEANGHLSQPITMSRPKWNEITNMLFEMEAKHGR